MKRFFLLLFNVCICSFLLAGPVDLEKARKEAMQFVSQKVGIKDGATPASLDSKKFRLAKKVMIAKNQPAYYVFDRDGGGFVIVSGDDTAAPVLGYSDKGSFNTDNLPEGLRDLLSSFEKQIAFVSTQRISKPRRINDNWAEISPLVKTHWDQDKPFNTLCPVDPTNNQRTITGCVSVALGQMMYYHKWPEVGTGTVSYQWKGKTLSADFSKVHFLWDKMKQDYKYNSTDEDNAVATLLYNCALAAQADFGVNETCASYDTKTLSKYFGYKDNMKSLSLNDTSIDDFEAIIYHELKNSRPVLFDASDEKTGHVMIIDGFKDGYFHINLGWRGNQDGYFQLTAILTDYYFFNTPHSIIYDIQPEKEPQVATHLYPSSSYVLSNDGKELVKWKGSEMEIDMMADDAFSEVRTIKSNAFSGNSAIVSVILPARTEVINTKAFENCGELEYVFIPQYVSKIESQAFTQCPYLDQFVVSDNSSNFLWRNGLLIDVNENTIVASAAGLSGDVSIPDGVAGISKYVFADRQISSVKIPPSLERIEEGAFMGCQLLSNLTLPAELDLIGAKAFKGCSALKQLSVKATSPPQVGEGAFDDINCSSVYLYVPSESMNQYLGASGWGNFTTVIALVSPEAKKLVVYLKNGSINSFILSEKPFVKNTGKDLVITTLTSSTTYKIDQIKKMMFINKDEEPTPIEEYHAYAWMSSDSKTLTFCYDDKRAERKGETYDLNTGYNYAGWNPDPWSTVSSVTTVVFESSFASFRPTNMYTWFCNFQNLTKITGLNYLNTSKVTNMSYMFDGCSSLTSLDVSHFDTSNCRDMEHMFYVCKSLTSLDVSHFNTTKVNDMSYMFRECRSLTNLDVSHFDTSNVTNMSGMFSYCTGLSHLDVSHFDTSNVTKMYAMFAYCYSLTSLNVSHFDTSKVTDMCGMFDSCSSLTSIDISNFDTSKCVDTFVMFQCCYGLKQLCLSPTMENFDETACSGVGNSASPCTVIAPEGFDFGVDTSGDYFVWKSGYFKMFGAKEGYAWLSSDGKTLTFCYDNKRAERSGNTYNLNTGYSNPEWNPDPWNKPCEATSVVFESSFAQARPQSTYSWFLNFTNLTEITGIENLNTSEVTVMYSMFRDCKQLKTLDLSHFNTSKVSMLWAMFDGCSNLESLDLSSFDTSKVTDFTCLFSFCYNLKSLNVSSFDTSNVTNMYMAFEGCRNLTSLDVSNFNTSNVTIMSYMFDGCSSLTSLDVSNFDTSKITTANQMFEGCSNLQNLKISSTMGNIDEDACSGVGSFSSPCTITAPENFDFGVETTGNYFYWKSGCFRFWYSKEAYAWLSSDKKTLTFCNDNSKSDRVGEVYSLNSGSRWGAPDWNPSPWENPLDVTSVVINPSFADVRPTSTCLWFGGFKNLSKITGLEYLNTSDVAIMSCMFDACSNLTNLDLKHFDTSNVTDFSAMFRDCTNLKSLDLSSFNTSKGNNMEFMFDNCTKLTSIDVTSFDVSNVRYMENMFHSCSCLTSLDLHNFNISNNCYTYELLSGCSGLNNLKISSSMSILYYDACSGVGTTSSPCTIIAPENFNFGVDTSGDYFLWKGGYFKASNSSGFANGDVNHDTEVNVVDVMLTVNYVLKKETPDFHFENADVNGSGVIDVVDIMGIVNIILKKPAKAHSVPTIATSDHIEAFSMSDGIGLSLSNAQRYTALEMTLTLPPHATLAKATLNGSTNHSVVTQALGDGMYRIVVYSLTGEALPNSDALIHLTISGAGNININDVLLTNTFFDAITPQEATGIQALPDFSQLPTYSHVEIFDTAGKMIKNFSIGETPQALDLNGIGIGVFFVKINGVTYKIVRK